MHISPSDFAGILSRYANPHAGGMPAGRVNAVLHDPTTSRELVVDWILTQVKMCVIRGDTLTPQLLMRICRRVSIETILHQALGIPVRLERAGCLFENARGLWEQNHGGPAPRRLWARLWDDAVRSHMLKSVERQRRGEIRSVVWLPLSDGRSSNPDRPYMMRCGGLDAWTETIHTPRMRDMDETVQLADRAHAAETFTPDEEWMRRHGVTASMVDRLDRRELDSLNVNLPDVDDDRPLTGKAAVLDLIVQDAAFARRLATERGSAASILVRHGMREEYARTGIVFERLLVTRPGLGRERTWRLACRMLETRKPGCAAPENGLMEYVTQVTDLLHPELRSKPVDGVRPTCRRATRP